MFSRRHLLSTAAFGALSGCVLPPRVPMSSVRPLLIAHRGASGPLPEHTLAAYRLGASQGADAIEPDLVMSKDGVLMARHDHYIGVSTNVSTLYPERRRTGVGVDTPEWFTEDFSSEELAQLRARQPWPKRDQSHNDQYAIASFDEVLQLRATLESELGRAIYVYPELKLPSYFAHLGLDPVPAYVDAWKARSSSVRSRILTQCFEADTLRRLREALGPKAKLTQLLPALKGDQVVEITIDEIARYANAIGAHKLALIDVNGGSTGLLEAAHARGLKVHVYTFRDDAMPAHYSTPETELQAFLALGVDGLFCDFPATARRVIDGMLGAR
jgi:glycerophosphoryl diester phosphodiesterase